MNHLLLKKAFIFKDERQDLSPSGCFYDFEKGAWLKQEDNGYEFLVNSNDPNKPIAGTKKADRETGEDQKGM
ncbi:hypothetical protein [Halobacillus sp. Nhm2S1]|uniref:hypothetical protein n=1 Tax=Halobacillus sp. Nhm2S1 TaxID=2866716 RepID=UPI001C736869|nr:hypothetical protein [Halobacillus sp. Nhm2S1]MBX0358482.1 hypothetical protein [Halobacillus sp. Nhm2S1]